MRTSCVKTRLFIKSEFLIICITFVAHFDEFFLLLMRSYANAFMCLIWMSGFDVFTFVTMTTEYG